MPSSVSDGLIHPSLTNFQKKRLTPEEEVWLKEGIRHAEEGHDHKDCHQGGDVMVWFEPWNPGCLEDPEVKALGLRDLQQKLEGAIRIHVKRTEAEGWTHLRTVWVFVDPAFRSKDTVYGVSVSIYRANEVPDDSV